MSALFPRLCSLLTTKTRRKKWQLLTENAELKRHLQDQETALWIAEALLTVRRATTPAPPLPVTDDDDGTVQTDTPLAPDVAAVEPVQESTVEPVPVIKPPKTAEAYLADIGKQAAHWNARPEDLDCLIREMLDFHPDMKDAAQDARKQGQSILDGLNKLYHLAKENGRNAPAVKEALRKFCQQYPDYQKQARSKVWNGHHARTRHQDEEKRKQSGFVPIITPRQIPLNRVTTPRIAPGKPQLPAAIPTSPLHAQDIRSLQPAANWTLIIDESGEKFEESTRQLKTQDRLLGRWVGLLIPVSGHGLPRLQPGWHATEQGSLDEIDRVFQCVLDANVGVLGLTVKQVSATTGELWATGVLNLIDWVLRLLPLDGPAKIQVSIENRSIFTKRMEWPALARDALRRLSIAYPERARRISMDIKLEDKWTQPFNGYVDVLAYTWGSSAEHSLSRLAASKLSGYCFLEGNARQILDAWEWLDRGIRIRPEDWTHLLAQPDVPVEGGLTATILQRLGESCRQDVSVWRGFADEVRRHLDSKAVDLGALGSQVEWLEQYRPDDEVMSPRLRLLWLTTQLASANHLGAVQQAWMREIEVLADRLMEEDAPLVCWADLHLAVNATNRFDFNEASRCLNRWRDVPRSVPGLRYWSQACSSLGQHAAFTGNYVMAKEGFQAALNGFAGLSEETMRQKNITQTATYLAIVEMDHGSATDARDGLERVMGSIPDAIHRLAVSNASNDTYLHHLLVRWLAYRGNQTERDIYLGYRNKWQTEYGHPWPLIQLYRGMLLHPLDPQAAADLAEGAYQLAMDVEQGPTVRLIGCCCRAVAQSWGRDWPEGQQRLDELESRLPAAKSCIDGLRQYLQEPASQNPLDMLARVLPFNFH